MFSFLYKEIKYFLLFFNVKVILWDFDGTLYQNKNLVLALENEFWKFYQNHCSKNTSLDDFRLIAGRYGGWSKAIVEKSNLSEINVIDEVEDHFEKSTYLEKDEQLLFLMKSLDEFQHIIVTNSREKDVIMCLDKLGFKTIKRNSTFFSKIFARDNMKLLKPSKIILERVVAFTGKKRNEHLMIGDSYLSDINPAKNFGFKAIHINDFRELLS